MSWTVPQGKPEKKQKLTAEQRSDIRATNLNKRIKAGDEQKIPKGCRAMVSQAGAVIMLVENSDIHQKQKVKPSKSAGKNSPLAKMKRAEKPRVDKSEKRVMKKKQKPPTTAANPFAGKKDIYLTPNKIAVTTTANSKCKRGFTKTTKTKYYAQNASNLRKLKAAGGGTVRVGRTGNNYKHL